MDENHNIPLVDSSEEHGITRVTGMFKEWFLDYASYVILERAVPAIEDGLKPVQRRILHSMKDLDDGRYNKVANIVGHTMQYHPHGDASISDAMVQMGQKDLLIDTQGNWGNILTGDSAAAARYIEARLSKFALEVVFSPKITKWQMSYDSRRKEPINLPVKFPLLLTQGAEGIAVGLSTKILPHNFIEIIEASIKHLRGKNFELYPDFITGGVMDVSSYNDGKRGGRVRIRAKISILDKGTLVITEIPFASNTSSLIDSILKANEKGKIKIKKIEDNTASEVEILVHLPFGISPDKTIDALYAFTACEVSISPLGCIIQGNKPLFIGVSEMLKYSTDYTVELIKLELEIQLQEFEEQWHFSSLERIFIENRIYRNIEEEDTWEGVINAIDKGLSPHTKQLKRAVRKEDIIRLTEIRIKRISKFDIDKAQQKIEALEGNIKEIKNHLKNLIDFTINYFKRLKKNYGKGKQRKTKIHCFEDIEATKVVLKNLKLYVNRAEGFVGTTLKKDEYVCECSDIDDVIIFTQSGKMMIIKASEKTFVGKDIIHVMVFKRKDKRTTYNMIYKDGRGGVSYMKRFYVDGVTRDKEYDLTQGKPQSKILYFTSNPNGEGEIITIFLREVGSIKKLKWNVDFSKTLIKSRTSKGNIVSKYAIKRIDLKEKGASTLQPRNIWFDNTVMRLNTEKRGTLLGLFDGKDRILTLNKKGYIKAVTPELSLHFDEDFLLLEKWATDRPVSVIHYDGTRDRYFVKRFVIENNNSKEECVITNHPKSYVVFSSTDWHPVVEITFVKERSKKTKPNERIIIDKMVSVKGIKALGNQLTANKVKQIIPLESLPHKNKSNEQSTNLTDESNQSSLKF